MGCAYHHEGVWGEGVWDVHITMRECGVWEGVYTNSLM